MQTKTKKIVKLSVAGALVAVLLVFSIVFAMFEPTIAMFLGNTSLDGATRAAGEALATQIEEEGIVMVQNEENRLPLSKADLMKDNEMRVNVFGWASTQWVKGGSGSGRATNNGDVTSTNTDFLKALTQAGIKYNTALTNKYKNFCDERPFYDVGTGGGALNVHDYEYCRLIEPQFSSYQADLLAEAKNFSDVAIVVIGRVSGESIDCPLSQYKNFTNSGTSPISSGRLDGAAVDKDRTYLDISKEEEDLLTYVGENYEKVVVIINSTNAMNLSFLETIDGLDSCLIVGGTGNNAANAIPGVLLGEKTVEIKDDNGDVTDTKTVQVSPSGKTVDTYVYDFKTNASFAYTAMEGVSKYSGLTENDKIYPFDGSTTNGNVNHTSNGEKYSGVSYLDYVEGIYVGYKWYETADAEGFWNNVKNVHGEGYEGVVQYPLGFGLTYTNFEWSVKEWKTTDKTISVTVQVTNTGDRAAQEVVELYFTPPYNAASGIEKSAVNLAAFAKTPTAVAPNETQELILTFNIQDMASYDEKGDGNYLLEKGNYEISLRTDSHTVATVNSGRATYTYSVSANKTFTTYEGANGTEPIHNLFTGENNSDKIAIDGSDTNQNIKWLSRSNFKDTFSSTKAADRQWNAKLKETNLFTQQDAEAWENAHKDAEPIKIQNNNIKVYDSSTKMINETGLEYGNPENYDNEEFWDNLLNQVTVNEMKELVLHAYVHEEPLPSIGKPETKSVDGPSQIGSFNQPTGIGVGYPMPTVLAQSWNAELAKSFGLAVGKETKGTGRNGWYAPGVNLHRSAFGGRNYEYYSEDSYLSGIMCAATVRGALNAGVYTYIKHFIGYDQESMRDGLYCWLTEQNLRETYLRPYKMAIDEGATGIMSSYGRIGSVWSGGSTALLTDLLRDEWGFKGAVITDYSDHHVFMSGDHMIRGGGDIWMDWWSKKDNGTGTFKYSSSSNAFNQAMRKATKHVVYMWLNAAFEEQAYIDYVNENGDEIITRTAAKAAFPWWWLVFAGVDVALAAGAGVLVFLAFKKPKKATAETETSEEQIND